MVFAQDIEVKKFELMEKDQTAALSPRKDINGTVCGLVKVAMKEPGAEFEGNVMGDVQFTGNEYLVYLPNGTKRLGIKHPDYLPTTIVFADYGTKKIASSTTYELKVKTNKKKAKVDNSKKGIAVFNIKPSNAMLLIDGQIADGSGGTYSLSLPYGTHYYTVKLKDFALTNQSVHIDKNAKNINVDLTEFFARVDVSCKTEDAELLVNNEQKGVGKWGGMMIPGKYTILAQKDGCHSQTRQIDLKDNDTVRVDFSALKTITGSLRVDYEPAGADVLLNGKKVGVTPLVLKELPIGDYHLEIWKEYYVKEFATVKIAEDQEWKERGKLKLTQFGEMIVNAENGKIAHMKALANYYRYGAVFTNNHGMLYTCHMDSVVVSINPVKAVYWYKKAMNMNDDDGGSSEARAELGPSFSTNLDDEYNSFRWASEESQRIMESDDEEGWYLGPADYWRPFAALAWHYCYGIGCKKDIDKARKLIKYACFENGMVLSRAYDKLLKDLGMSSNVVYYDWNSEILM
jgi:hypothetical protein